MTNKELLQRIQEEGIELKEKREKIISEVFTKYLDGAYTKELFIKGETMVEEGEVGKYVYVIERGKVILVKNNKGKRYSNGYLLTGEFFDMSSYTGIPYPSTYMALSNSSLIKIDISKIKDITGACQEARSLIVEYIVGVWNTVNKRYGNLSIGGCRESYINFILEHVREYGRLDDKGNVIITLDVTLTDIATLLNMTRETLSRIVSDMKKEGILDSRRRIVKIMDLDKLVQLA